MSRSDRILVAAVAAAVVLAVAAGWIMLAPAVGDEPPDDGVGLVLPSVMPVASTSAAPTTATIVVDVQGAVAQPGVRELPAGARVADAVAAAGGYAADADLAAASTAINLAQPLVDGAQIRVPRIGDAAVAAAPGGAGSTGGSAPGGVGAAGGGAATGGPLNINTATPEELEALPGIGPVTVQKIVAARQESPFASLEEAVERGVINRGQLEDLQGIATAG